MLGAPSILRPMVVALPGSSETTGYLSADWVPRLNRDARTFPEARGPIFLLNLGKGGRTSLDGLAQAPLITGLRPTHILTEGYGINDCFDTGGGPAVSPATHIADIQSFIGQWQANIPGVDITLQTMNSVSSFQTARTALGSYYASELTTAAGLGVNALDNYAGWPKPLDPILTHGQIPWAITPTAGFLSLGFGATWNPADKSSALTLSDNDLTITSIGSGMVRGNMALTGKIHFEIKVTATVSNYPAFGIANGLASLSTWPGAVGPNGIGAFVNSVYMNSVSVGSLPFSITAGDIIGIEVDRIANFIYFMKGGLRSTGFDISGITGAIYAALGNFTDAITTTHFTNNGDGLHPIWIGADDTYLYPNVVAWLRAKMAAFWP